MDPMLMQVVLIVGFVAVMYFFMIRPNKKRQQEMLKMRESLKQGDSIITIGGIKGKVVKVTDDSVVIETSSEKTKMEFLKSAIHTVVTKSDEKCDEVEENKEV
ncbi:preprotein translocase, YajC subunit [Tissierellia bacterium KA00581]|nr:preprotein translocase, YajC subunit [Tissierellia bacterium KA00581]